MKIRTIANGFGHGPVQWLRAMTGLIQQAGRTFLDRTVYALTKRTNATGRPERRSPGFVMLLAAGLLLSATAEAQINYTQDFTGCNSASCNGWTISGGHQPSITASGSNNYSSCSGASAKSDIYSSEPDAVLQATTSLGTSSGLLATFGFDYKCIRYSNGASGNNYATFTVQWATSASGPWTTAGSTFNSTSHTSCSAAPTRTFTPPAGQPIYVQILAHRNANDFWVVMDNITLTQGAAAACSGTPAPGNTTTTNATPCSGENFTLGTQNATSGSGVTYQWQSSTAGAGGPFNNNGLGTASTQLTSTTVPTWYQVIVSCSGNPGTSTPVAVTPTLTSACYCTSNFGDASYESISNVTYGSINNSSGANAGGPVDYTAHSTTVTPGTSQNLSVTINADGNEYIYAFIDWDRNGILNDAGEVYTLASSTSSNGPHTLSVTVPLTASAGSTLMRVMVDYSNPSPDPCRSANYGEAENYTVIVEACTGPTPTATASNDGPVCDGDPLQLTGGTDVGNTFTWTGPNGFNSTAQNPSLNPATLADGGTYTLVVGTMGNTCVSAPASTTVVVNAVPSGVTAGASLGTVCSGSTVDLTGTGDVSSTPLSEDFEGVAPGWTVTNNSTGGTPANAAWALYTSNGSTYSNDNSTFAGANSDSQGFGGTTNTTLNSPVFSLAGMSSATLTFYQYFRATSGDVGNVQVSTDGATWTTVQSYTATTGTATGFTAASVDLSAYTGNTTVHLRFEYLANWGWYWYVDNVSVTASSPVSFSWASAPAGFGSNVQNPTGVTVTENTDYTVTATSNGCSATATTSVNAVPQPNAGIDGAITLCSNGTPVTLLGELGGSPDAGGTWSGGATPGTFDPATDAAGAITYTVAPTAPCLNNDQSQVIVTVVQSPNPGQNGSLTVCDQSAPENILAALTGSPDAGGNWNGPSAVVNDMYDPNTMDPGVYTYTVSGTPPCVNAQATVTVNEVASPDAGSNGALSVCSGGAAANMFNELGGNPNTGGSWNGPSPVVNDMYDPNTMDPGVYTYTVNPVTPCAVAANASVTVTESGHEAVVRIRTDANGDQITWEIRDAANGVLATGGPSAGQNNMVVDQTVCLSDLQGDCYSFKLMDSFGDGLTGAGYWQLRTASGKVLLGDDFATGANSPSVPPMNPGYGSSHDFCLPEGSANIAPTECGIMNNTLLNKVYCNKVAGASMYQFEFSDPDAGFRRWIARNRNYVIFNEMVSVPLTPGVKYFARVRTDRDGPLASAHFGSGCEMGLGAAQVAPCTELIHAPAYGHSCDETRAFNTNNSFIYARPVVGATEYQFRLINAQEGYDQTFIRSTYILQLKWNNNVAPMLVDGYTYNVQINVKVNGLYSGFCSSDCDITIDNSGNRPAASMAQANFGETTLWPNPVRDGQVHLNIDGMVDVDQKITVDVQDIYGKQVFAQEFGNSGERFNTILDLSSDIASGVYMVNITVNGKRTVKRLSIIR